MEFLRKLLHTTQSDDNINEEAAALKQQGIKALQAGNAEQAVALLSKSVEKVDDLETRDYLAQALIKNDELLPAFKQLALLLKHEPDNLHILVTMAHIAARTQDYYAMGDVCNQALKLAPDNDEVNYLAAVADNGKGDFITCVALLTKALALNADNADAYLLRGQVLLKLHDAHTALADASHALQLMPDSKDALLLKAQALEAMGKHAEAIDEYGRVIELDPYCVQAFRERGAIKLAKGDKQGAETDMESVLELNPQLIKKVTGHYDAEGQEDIQRVIEKARKRYGMGKKQ